MNKPHKHAKLIKAWADGAEIERKNPLTNEWVKSIDPMWVETSEYRIKSVVDIPEGFTEWNGGECLVPKGTIVDVVFRDGEKSENRESGQLIWTHCLHEDDIIAYKVVKNAPVVRWQWILKGSTGAFATTQFYKNENEVKNAGWNRYTIIGKAEWSRTEFDE